MDNNIPVNKMIDSVVKPVPKSPNVKPGELYTTHEGILHIAGFDIKCYVLNDGKRIFDAEDIKRAFPGLL